MFPDLHLFIFIFVFHCCNALNEFIFDYETKHNEKTTDIIGNEVILQPLFGHSTNHTANPAIIIKNINCENFKAYVSNCEFDAAKFYGSSTKSPPMPDKLEDWCKAIRHLSTCAMDWNTDCKYVTDEKFNEETIQGHIHVLNNACDDYEFLSRYQHVAECVENSALDWEKCYTTFRIQIAIQKNSTLHWTHYETHFYLCCSRAQFRRCALQVVADACSRSEAVTLQKYAVILSEGDVFQDCDRNVMYLNCPGGDPRPPVHLLKKLLPQEKANNRGFGAKSQTWLVIILLFPIDIPGF